MSVGLDHPAVAAYLARLDAAAVVLPPGRREELVTEIRGHLLDSLADAGHPDDATVLGVLDRLGDPESIVAAEASETIQSPVPSALPATPPVPPPGNGLPVQQEGRWGPLEIIAVAALTVGTFLLPIIGPLIGIVCSWLSPRWTRGEKTIASVLAVIPVVVVSLAVLSLIAFSASTSEPVLRQVVVTATPVPVPPATVPPPVPSDSVPPGGATP